MATSTEIPSNAELLDRVRAYPQNATKDLAGGDEASRRREMHLRLARAIVRGIVPPIKKYVNQQINAATIAKKEGPMNEDEFGEFLAAHVHRSIEGVVAQLREEIAALKDAAGIPGGLRAIAPNWRGVFALGKTYSSGAVCCHHNALWIAKDATAKKPGEMDSGWVLVMKSPR